jgi:hypothetical protein
MMPSSHSKKRKASTNAAKPAAKKQDPDRAALHKEIGYEPLTLQDIRDRLIQLCRHVPPVPAEGFESDEKPPAVDTSTLPVATTPCPYDKAALREWATKMQTVLEEFQLLIAVVSAATYRWGTDRSGAADQNLNVLSDELMRAQEQILGRVSPRLSDVLAPVVSLITDKTVTIKTADNMKEIKQNYYITTQEDPDYVNLCYTVLARNAVGMRQVVLANFDKLLQAVSDYLEAQHKDSQHDSRGFLY